MIAFQEFTLSNGLRVIFHEDRNVQIAVMNVLYDVGSRDEDPDKTGFAHLFEHLMFGGSVNIPDYDSPLEHVGGENNAFTSNDITNYYLLVPSLNVETGFWLESDRMLGLSFDPKSLEVQRRVVIEEFKERYLNQPYGDVWLKFRPLVYQRHPYQWATIGKEASHIEQVTMEDVKAFFFKHYVPSNAILVVAGNISRREVETLANKWFGEIPAGVKPSRSLPGEPVQTERRFIEVSAQVPADALYMAWHMPGRFEKGYYPVELACDILSEGHSSRMYNTLVKEKEIFTSVSAYSTGTIDPGLLVVSGRVRDGVALEDAEEQVHAVLDDFLQRGATEKELDKVKNQTEAELELEDLEVANRAMNLAFAKLSGDANLINTEKEMVKAIGLEEVEYNFRNVLKKENESVMYYRARK